MYLNNSYYVFQFLGFSPSDFKLTQQTGGVTVEWFSAQIQPTEQQVIDANNNLTVVNGKTFSQWYAENGGDAIATAKKIAKDLQNQTDATSRALKAIIQLLVDGSGAELNLIRQFLQALKTQTGLATTFTNFQTRIAQFPDMPDRTLAQAKKAINNIIDGD